MYLEFTEKVVVVADDNVNGNTLSIVSISLDTLFNIRPIGVVSNRLIGLRNIRVFIRQCNNLDARTVPRFNDIADTIVDTAIIFHNIILFKL